MVGSNGHSAPTKTKPRAAGYSLTVVDGREFPETRNQWGPFCEEVALRLERTSRARALRAEFDTLQTANNVRKVLYNFFHGRRARGIVSIALREEASRGVLYIRRGKNYEKRGEA